MGIVAFSGRSPADNVFVSASMYNDKCQAEPMINVYLYVAGAIGFVSFAYALVFLVSSTCPILQLYGLVCVILQSKTRYKIHLDYPNRSS